jgi:hypothetical protein
MFNRNAHESGKVGIPLGLARNSSTVPIVYRMSVTIPTIICPFGYSPDGANCRMNRF